MIRTTDADWQEWGERDPYFGVVTHSQFRKDRFKDNKEEFFASGERDVELAITQAGRFGGPLKFGRALDFACGVGRLLIPLSHRFEEVVGVDISHGMMREARKNIDELGRNNVSIHESDDDLSKVSGTFDFVLSKIALQHIPVQHGMRMLRSLLNRVNSGGGAVLDFSVEVEQPLRKEFQYHKYRLVRLLKGRDKIEPPMKMHSYSLRDLLREFDDCGMKDISMDIQKHFGVVFVATISARKP
ncbi:class I SAM-dependent methyltransferase [Bradyrhizobium sp. 1]|uniref:class I SAM-dependent methyltransferase n=1 Tax=Bradyrhizobium sp. 1 TaxID=241591 RepID=UPI001FFA9FE0|nr:class I SAM-dependent methyltransferase [Bradyrhizobium sp. 1]MCK1396134.1 class I SAM-dependent methyltransferase [Bradyrhizobium sp. 1]